MGYTFAGVVLKLGLLNGVVTVVLFALLLMGLWLHTYLFRI